MEIENLKQSLKKFLKNLNPLPPVGGLEISDLALRFIWIKNGELVTANFKLPPNIVESGKIKDRVNFVSALKNLRSQIPQFKKNNYVILIVPPNNVYTQVFNIPFLAGERIEEAARLNLQMISPIDIKTAYSSWQKIGETQVDGGQFELLGAFAEIQAIEDYIGALKEADFKVAAIEFPSLALVRSVARLGENVDITSPYLVLQVSNDGVAIIIMRNGNLYFSHFNSWRSLHEEIGRHEITLDDFKIVLIKEIQRIINFYSTHWGGKLDKLVLASEGLTKELTEIIESNFTLKVSNLTLKEFNNIAPSWFSVLGAALRGLIPRSSDNYVSLTAITVQKEYFRTRVLNFSALWRNIAITTASFLFLIFLLLDSFLWRMESQVKEGAVTAFPTPTVSEIDQLKTSANSFNRLISLAYKASGQTADWLPLLKQISNLAGDKVIIERFSSDSMQKKVLFVGRAINETEVIEFKNKLLKETNFSDVDLRLSEVKIRPDGSANFSVIFKLKSLKFEPI